MKKIGFIGAYDKTDLIIYIARILTENDLKVLIIDGTILQKTRYTVPCIEPSMSYITTYENIDIAIGFETYEKIKEYIGKDELDYDYIFLDIDNRTTFEGFEIQKTDKKYFVTAFDNYSLRKGLEVIGTEKEKIPMTKLLFSKDMDKSEDEYLDFLSFYYAVKWEKNKIYFPFESGDNAVIIENQRSARISYKELSTEYKAGITDLLSEIAPEVRLGDIKKMLKNV